MKQDLKTTALGLHASAPVLPFPGARPVAHPRRLGDPGAPDPDLYLPNILGVSP